MSASRFGDRPASRALASLSDAARVARPKRVYLYSAQQDRRDDDDDARQPEAIGGDGGARHLDDVVRQQAGRVTARRAVDEDDRGLGGEQDAQRRDELRQRRSVAQRTEHAVLAGDAQREGHDQADDGRGPDRQLDAEEAARVEREEEIARHHRDGARGQVDDARAAVGEHDPETDAGDQRAGPEPEECEEDDLVHVCLRMWREGRRGRDGPPAGQSLRRDLPTAGGLELALALVGVELRLVVADTRSLGVLAALNRRRAPGLRALEGLGLLRIVCSEMLSGPILFIHWKMVSISWKVVGIQTSCEYCGGAPISLVILA